MSKEPTLKEALRMSLMIELGCVPCNLEKEGSPIERPEVHHICEGHRRLGHWYSIPICPGHHRGAWSDTQKAHAWEEFPVALSDGPKLFRARYGSERDLWWIVQKQMDLDTDWPESKIVARRSA